MMLDAKKFNNLFNEVLVNIKPKLMNVKEFPLSLNINGNSYLLTVNYYRTQPGYYNLYYLNLMEGYKKGKTSTVLNPLGFNKNEIILNDIKRKSKRHEKEAKTFNNFYEPFKKALKKLIAHQLDPMWY